MMAYDVACDSRDIQSRVSPNSARPAPTMTLLPIRTASLVPAIDATATETASGSSRTPVLSGLNDFTTWKYWVIRKMRPSSAKNAIATAPLAAVKRGFLKRLMSIIGWADARSTATRQASTAAPAARAAMVDAEPQPQSGAWITPKTSRPIPAVDRARPSQSTGGVARSRDVGTPIATPTTTTAATRAMNTKMLPHQNRSSSQPPTIGPSAPPPPPQPP